MIGFGGFSRRKGGGDRPPLTPASRWRRYLLEGLVVLGGVLLIHFWQVRHVPAGFAPEISGQLSDGATESLSAFRARHPGQVVALHFWAEWCPICRMEEGNVSAVIKEVPLLTVAMQSGDGAAIARVLAARELVWPTLVDDAGAMSAAYGLKGVPAFIVIDAAGNIRFAEVGYITRFGMRWRLWWAARFL